MSRKDYKLIAEAIRRAFEDMLDCKEEIISTARVVVVGELLMALKYDNPKFDKDIFRKACGLP